MYYSILDKYMTNTNILISAHYWDPKSPKMFEKKDINKFKNLKVIGDITCDVNGSIPTTYRSSTIQKPYYFLNYENLKEIDEKNNSLAVMAVDNLPSELPKDSSEEFGNGMVNEVLPFIINDDDGRIKKATITENGEFLPNYIYVKEYMNN
jgi:alanine dehydrogenase